MTKKEKITVKKINFQIAQIYSSKFNNENFFTSPNNIEKFNLDLEWWLAFKGQEAVCLWPIFIDNNKFTNKPLFFYYFGPIWSQNYKDLNNHSVLSKKSEVLDKFINEFNKVYKNLIFDFDYTDLDIRFFLWINDSNKYLNKKFMITPQYSSVIFDLDKKNKEDLLSGFRVLRRRMIKNFLTNNDFIQATNFSLKEVLNLYNETITRKNNLVDKDAEKFISSFHEMCKGEKCKMIGFRNKNNNEIASVIMLALEKKTANLILNLTSYKYKTTGLSAYNMMESILYAKKLNFTKFDFNGANSKIGAEDKQSYGGDSKLYFQIEFKNL